MSGDADFYDECPDCGCDPCQCIVDSDDDENWPFDCHMGRDGLCGKAGSEECDFECPYRAEQIAQEARKRAQP